MNYNWKSGRGAAALVAWLAAGAAFGEVPDVSGALEFVGNPTLEKWASPVQANSVMDLQAYGGKIYLGTGDWSANKGPVPIWAYDPVGGTFTNELTAGTDAIEFFRVCSDGRLYAPATDPHESAANVGSLFRKELDGRWTIFPNYSKAVLPSSSGTAQLVQHVFDVEICKTHLFMSGNGIAKSDNDGGKWSLVDNYYPYGTRMNSLIRCGDEIFCKGDCAVYFSGTSDESGTVEKNSIGFPTGYMWRWKETTGVFETFTNKWTNIAPGLKRKHAALQHGSNATLRDAGTRFWHATPFGKRCLYVLGDNNVAYRDFTSPVAASKNAASGTRPMMAASGYAADDGSGGRILKADRIALPDGTWPIDFCVDGDTAYMLTFAYNASDQNVRHGVWQSTDGVTFTQILSFDYQQVMMSIEHLDGAFYFGVAHKNAMIALGVLKSGTSENAGRLYRLTWPVETDYPDPVDGVVTITRAGSYSGVFPAGMAKLVIDASGEVVIATEHESYAGEIVVKSGSRLEVGAFKAFGGAASTVTVESGATFVLTVPKEQVLNAATSFFNPSIVLAGTGTDGKGALAYEPSSASGGKNPDNVFRSVTLSGDATISVTTRWGINRIDLAGHTLTRTGTGTGNNWMLNGATVTAGRLVNTAGSMTWQNARSTGSAADSSIEVSGGSLTLWENKGYPITIPVVLRGGVLTAGWGLGTEVNRLTSSFVITNAVASSSTSGSKALNFEGPVRVDASGRVIFGNSGTNTFASTFTARDEVRLNYGTYVFKDAVSVPRTNNLITSGGDIFFESDGARDNFAGLVVTASGRMTLKGGTLSPRMLRVANGGAYYGAFRNAAGAFIDDRYDTARIGESAGSFGVFVQEAGATTTFSNAVYVGLEATSHGFICQRGGLFAHRNAGLFQLGKRGNGFLWVAGGTNDSHFSKVNAARFKMSEENGTATLVVRGKGSLLQTDSLLAGSTTNPTTNTIAVTDGGTLRAHRLYSVAGRAAGSFSCVQIDGGVLAPSYFSAWGDVGKGDASFYARTFDRVTVHAGGVVFDTTGCVNDKGVEADMSFNALNFERPSGRGVKAIALPTDEAFKALKYRSPVPIVFEGAGYGATAYAEFDDEKGVLTGVVVGSAGCACDATTRAYVLGPTGKPTKHACAITLTDDNRPAGPFTKRGEKVELALYGTNECTAVTVESGTLTACGPRALPQNVPITVRRGALLYLNGGTFAVSSLEGEGRIANAKVALGEGGAIHVTAEDLFAAEATPLAVSGELALGKGTRVVVRDSENLERFKGRGSAAIATAGTLTGETPTLEAGAHTAGWRVYRAGNAVRIGYRGGLTLVIE